MRSSACLSLLPGGRGALDMDVYRAYREYRMEQAELDSAEWAEKSKRRRLTLFQRVLEADRKTEEACAGLFLCLLPFSCSKVENEAVSPPCILF